MKTKPILIEGKKIILRDWSIDDLSTYEYWQKPDRPWKKLDGPYYQSTLDNSNELTAKLQKQIEEDNFPSPRMSLAIADHESNKLLGFVSAYWESIETNWLCIGIVIYDHNVWGQGIGNEAMSLWIDYLFTSHPQIVRLDMRTWSGNTGLMKLASKLGFSEEARFRKARIVEGQYYDGLGFGILRSEWDSRVIPVSI